MVKGIYDAAQSMVSRQKNIEIIANNLANISTVGYKRSLPFSEVLAREDGKKETSITDFTEGSFSKTNNPFDVAVNNKKFFLIRTEKGIELTSNGKFKMSDDGYLVDQEGHYVVTKRGRVNIQDSVVGNQNNFSINKNGEILVGDAVVDQLLIAQIENQDDLKRTETQRFMMPEGGYSFAQEGSFEIFQGYLEDSNVNPVVEMQNLITINKDYGAAQKMISSIDSVMGMAKEIGRV